MLRKINCPTTFGREKRGVGSLGHRVMDLGDRYMRDEKGCLSLWREGKLGDVTREGDTEM